MSGQLWLYWFPIVLAVGVAAALLGRRRAVPVSVVGGFYWVILSMSIRSPEADSFGYLLRTLLEAMLITGIGLWMAGSGASRRVRVTEVKEPVDASGEDPYRAIADVFNWFDEWLACNRNRSDPWPDFGEFVRSALNSTCGAKYVRGYRLLPSDMERLHPLRRTEPEESGFPSSRKGILGHVVTTGRSYYRGDPAQGDLVERLATEANAEGAACAWCFAVKQHSSTIGVVKAAEMGPIAPSDVARLRLIERVISNCWIVVTEACRSRTAGSTDPVSGVLTREAFVETAARALRDSYDHGEPVALVTVSLEGLRRMTDSRRWELASQILFETSALLSERIRQDDHIGVFDESRFLLLLRRVDSELAQLIIEQLMEQLAVLLRDTDRWGEALTARCGVAGSGVGQPSLKTLISRATVNCREARKQRIAIVSDLATQGSAAAT